ncbi:dipeptide epimerase [Nocardioides sp. KR10-350]|uniref:dipeptide epimerase n=1 Tax=Nocardioides cheoyonin TaxID=3156615 RepID=UPI0032B5CE09
MAEPLIAGLRTEVVRVPLHTPFVTALRRTEYAETLVVELTDADGLSGWGEAPQVWRVTGDSIAGSRACLEGPLRDVLVGAPADPRETGPRIQDAVVGNHAAKMAADVALHDLAARRTGRTLAEHLAALEGLASPARHVITDVTLSAGEPAELAEAAAARAAEGFTTLKVKVGTDAATDAARVLAVRAAAGPDVVLRLDANQGWDAHDAVRVISGLEDAGAGIEIVEQPVRRRDLHGLAYVRRSVRTPVMADEAVFDLDDLVDVIRYAAADCVNIKLAKCGGLTPALELLEVAGRHGLGRMVGCMMESHLGIGAGASLVAALGLPGAHDLDAGWWARRSPYLGGVVYEGPRIVLPDHPGLGISGVEEP